LRKLILGAVAASATLALTGGVAAGQTAEATLKATVSPKDAGTARNPKNTKLGFQMTVNKPKTTVEFIDLQLPAGLKMSGKGFKRCPLATVESDPSQCPAGSKAGPLGTAEAVLGATNQPLHFTVQSYVLSSTTFAFYVSESTGLQVQAPLTGRISDAGRHLRITIPFELRQPVGGLDASLTGLKQVFSGKRGSNYIVSSVGCKKKKHKFGAKLTFSARADLAPVPPPLSATASAPCTK
jgi:hypothetical protein